MEFEQFSRRDISRRTFLAGAAVAAAGAFPGSHSSIFAGANDTLSAARGAALVFEGKATAVIALPSQSNAAETLAAQELIVHVEKMSGIKLEVATADAEGVDDFLAKSKKEGRSAVFIGRNVAGRLADLLRDRGVVRGAFALRTTQGAVMIAGNDEGVAFAVSELLEQQGVRWFMPGDLGTVIPDKKTIVVPVQETVQSPGFASRWMQMPNTDWQARVRCGGRRFAGSHGLPHPKVKVNRDTGEIEPAQFAEFFSLNKGKRTLRQHCVSNPKLIEFVAQHMLDRIKTKGSLIVGMGPNDGGGFCECDSCRALDGGDVDPFAHQLSMTDRYIWFFNQVLEKLGPGHDDVRIAFYIYADYIRPPVRYKPDQRITGALAPITLDRVHGFSNPVAPEKSYAKSLLEQWCKLLPEIYDRGYWSNLSDPGFPFIIVHRLRDEIPASHGMGLKGWRVETFPNYGPQLPSMYVAAKLMWNPALDVDALLSDFARQFFGPAADPMGHYIALMDAALRDADYCTGSAWDMPHFYPAALRDKARALLEQAAKRVDGKGIYAQRVEMIAQTFEMLEAFIAMMDARVKVDFITAQKQLERLDAVANLLMAYKPVPMVSAGRHSSYTAYMRRFFRPATEQGFARVTGGNRLIAAAQDEWDFQIDPARVGEAIGLFRPDLTGGNWQRLKTSSLSWSDQGLRYYKGLAWYRQTVDVPAKAAGQRLFLWCGGVDEKAKVWLNGQLIGISPGSAFSPFEMDATPAVRAGPNVITFCIANEVLNEIGTGGILAPVMLYAPAAGKEALLDNGKRGLSETFP